MRKLSGCVQIDDAYLGGESSGGNAGSGSENKPSFLIAVQTNASFTAPMFVVIKPVRSFDNASLRTGRHVAWRPKRGLYRRAGLLASPGGRRPRPYDAGHRWRAAPAGSMCCLASSNALSAACITVSRKANTQDVIWPRRPTVSVADSACAICCHDSPRR